MTNFKKVTKPEQLQVGRFYVRAVMADAPIIVPFELVQQNGHMLKFTLPTAPELGEFDCHLYELFQGDVYNVDKHNPILLDKTTSKNHDKYSSMGLAL